MTYCIAISTNNGLVFCSDSRTNAGPDMLSSYSKMHLFQPATDRVFCILSAGNLATTQAIIERIRQDIDEGSPRSLLTCQKINEGAHYVAEVSREEQNLAQQATGGSGIDTSASILFGGQIQGGKHRIYLVYSAGNFISDSDETPFLQIGESKYGKPILDRILHRETSLDDAARCAIVSMDSTIRSNATVGPPIEVLVYEADSFNTAHYVRLDAEDTYLRDIKRSWDETLKAGFLALPLFEWEKRSQIGATTTGAQPPQTESLPAEPLQQQPVAPGVPGNDQ
ncbi:MAG: peptidase [Pseudomonadales bacterium]|nr:peptidase [Halieaceae bacterium]MCP5189624.1 peptidase [Pseudomonadales bacterium]MCP5203892.1 peptidase [Pseudomonadales bacterium]